VGALILTPMNYIIVGLGNPGMEYENTRHNAGRMVLETIGRMYGDIKSLEEDFDFDKKLNAHKMEVKIGKEKVTLLAPDTFMNLSGKSVAYLVKNVKSAGKLIVIYDDFNLPLGRIKVSWNRSSGGHNGLESIIKAVKTEEFARVRVGTAPEKANGDAKTPHGDKVIEKFILGKFKEAELKTLKKVSKTIGEAVEVLIKEGLGKAMSVYNTS